MSSYLSEDLREVVFHVKSLPNLGGLFISFKKIYRKGKYRILFRIFIRHKNGNEENVFVEVLDSSDVRDLALKLITLTSQEEKDWKYFIERIRENLVQLQNVLELADKSES